MQRGNAVFFFGDTKIKTCAGFDCAGKAKSVRPADYNEQIAQLEAHADDINYMWRPAREKECRTI